MGSRRPDGCIKGNVGRFAPGRSGFDVSSTLALGVSSCSPTAAAAGQPIQRGFKLAGNLEFSAGVYPLAAVPPAGVLGREKVLPGGLSRPRIRGLVFGFL
ncbi:MAG: hypothetical protein JW963_01685 [Anaerolineales bacterium]|nr:hypothetical protein [Anaerolineales bacterium]